MADPQAEEKVEEKVEETAVDDGFPLQPGADEIKDEDLGDYFSEEEGGDETTAADTTEKDDTTPEPEATDTAAEETTDADKDKDKESTTTDDAEGAESGKETAAEAGTEEDPDSGDKTPPAITIPKHRLDQEAARRRAAEARTAELEKQLSSNPVEPAAPPPVEVDEVAIRKALDKTLDGDLDTAVTELGNTMKSIAQAAADNATFDFDSRVSNLVDARTEQREQDVVIEKLEKDYDVFNNTTDVYDKELVRETLALKVGFVAQGYGHADAMQTAANYALKMHHPHLLEPVPEGDTVVDTETPVPTPVPTPVARDPKAIKRNTETAAATPPELPLSEDDEGSTTTEFHVEQMSADEYDALPETTRRRLRGDFV